MKKRMLLPMLLLLAPACGGVTEGEDSDFTGDEDQSEAMLSTPLLPITWRISSGAARDQKTGPATSIVIPKPAGVVAGDVEIAAISSYHSVTVSPPAGWSLIKAQTDTGTTIPQSGVGTSVFWRLAGANEPATYTFGFSSSVRGVATIQAYANVNPQSPVDAVVSAAKTAVSTQHQTPALTTTTNGTVLMSIYGILSPMEPASATSTMHHERFDRSSGNTGSWGIGLAVYDSNTRMGPAKEGGRVAVSTSATDSATMTLLALRPKSPGATALFGASFHPHDNARYDQMTLMFGDLGVSRSFDLQQGVSPFLNTYQSQDLARGAASAFSFKYLPSEVTAGKHNVALESFFKGIADNHPVFWTYWHEPDDEIFNNNVFTASAYRAAWTHIKAIADKVKVSRPNLEAYATLIIMEYSMRPEVMRAWKDMYPGNNVIDVFGVDAYNPLAVKGGTMDPATQFGKVIDFAKLQGKPWAVGELGSCPVAGNLQGRATYLTKAIQYWISRSYPPVYTSYFNLSWPVCDYRLDSDAPAKQVWHNAVTTGLGAF